MAASTPKLWKRAATASGTRRCYATRVGAANSVVTPGCRSGVASTESGGRSARSGNPAAASSSSSRCSSSASTSGHGSCVLRAKIVRPRCRSWNPHRAVRKRLSGVSTGAAPWSRVNAGARSGAGASSRAVLEGVGGEAHPGLGPAVGQTEQCLRGEDGGQPFGVERAEHHPALTLLVDRVGAHVDLDERASTGHGRQRQERVVAQHERDEPHPRAAVVHVGPRARRQHRRDELRVDAPVEEHEVAPALADDRAARQRGRDRAERWRDRAERWHSRVGRGSVDHAPIMPRTAAVYPPTRLAWESARHSRRGAA